MATPADYNRGDMDVSMQTSMYHRFNGLLHWGALLIATGLTFFVLWLCAHAGFLPSLIMAAIVIGLGSLMLRGSNSNDG